MLIESLEGELAVRMLMPLFCIGRKKNTFFVRVDKEIYECHYEESSLSLVLSGIILGMTVKW